MFTIHRKEIDWGGRPLILETGHVARQAAGSVMAQYGDTVVLCTVANAPTPRVGIDFFPLTVNYQEKDLRHGQDPRRLFQA